VHPHPPSGVSFYFFSTVQLTKMEHPNIFPSVFLNVVANYAIFTTSSYMFLADQNVSRKNKCYFWSSNPTPLNSRSLRVLSIISMFICVFPPLGDVGTLCLSLCALLPLFRLVLFYLPWLTMMDFDKSSNVISDFGDTHGVVDSTQDLVLVGIIDSSITRLD
jgi:hypothetical protein